MGEIDHDNTPASAVAQDLLHRCNHLLSELDQFEQLLIEHKKPPVYGHRGLMQHIQAEKRFIERLLAKHSAAAAAAEDSPESDGRIKHQLSSTNLGSYEAIWTTVKQCRGLVALRQTFWRNPTEPKPSHRGLSPASKAAADRKKTRDGVLVDAVVEGGAQWVKVSAISEHQLIFQMARQGWHNDSDSDDDDDEGDSGRPAAGAIDLDGDDSDDDDDDDDDEVGIVKTSRALARAARANRYKYRHPRVRLVLPKITEGRIKEVDSLLARIRSSTGISLETSSSCTCTYPSTPAPKLPLTNLVHDPSHAFTPTLNIDCTLLVALASDISHARVAPQPWFPAAVRAQIRDEAQSALLPRSLYPALAARRLVCTAAAARRMREIVATIGTETEVARARILLGEEKEGKEEGEHPSEAKAGAKTEAEAEAKGTGEAKAEAETEAAQDADATTLLDQLQALSIHPVPRTLQLPIHIEPSPYDAADPHWAQDPALPAVARAVAPKLTPINRSIFLHGWAAGATTLSSNGTVARQIEGLVERHRTRDDEAGPDVWVCPVARSLVAKRGRRQDKEDGDGDAGEGSDGEGGVGGKDADAGKDKDLEKGKDTTKEAAISSPDIHKSRVRDYSN